MHHMRILVVVNGPSQDELNLLRRGIEQLLNKYQADEAKELIDYDDLVAARSSLKLRNNLRDYGYCISVGKSAKDKIISQTEAVTICLYEIAPVETWNAPGIKRSVAEVIKGFVDDWKSFKVEKQLLLTPLAPTNNIPAPNKSEWIEANVKDFERYLELMLKHGRYPVCVYKDDGTIEIKDGTRKLQDKVEKATPVLCPDDSVQGLDIKSLSTLLKNNGYEIPYFLPLREFITTVRIICQTSTSGKAKIEVSLGKN